VWGCIVMYVFDVRRRWPGRCRGWRKRMGNRGGSGSLGGLALTFTSKERQQGAQGPFGGASCGAELAAAPSPHRRADRAINLFNPGEEVTNEQYDTRMGAFRGLSVTINSVLECSTVRSDATR
jgi:hypothetical protein